MTIYETIMNTFNPSNLHVSKKMEEVMENYARELALEKALEDFSGRPVDAKTLANYAGITWQTVASRAGAVTRTSWNFSDDAKRRYGMTFKHEARTVRFIEVDETGHPVENGMITEKYISRNVYAKAE